MASLRHQQLITCNNGLRIVQHQQRAHHSQPKTLLLSFLLVSCLISINCASFGRRLSSSQQWSEPEYRFYSTGQDESRSLDDLVGRLSSPEAEKYAESLNNNQQQSEGYYYGLLGEPSYQAEAQFVEQLPSINYNQREVELLPDEKEQLRQQHIDISSPLYLLLDRSRETNDNSVAYGQKRLEPEAQADDAAISNIYKLIEDNANDSEVKQTDRSSGKKHSNFTTLLEEDESNEDELTTTTTPKSTTTTSTSTTGSNINKDQRSEALESQPKTASNVTKTPGGEAKDEAEKAHTADRTSLSSVLSKFYAKLSAYLPFTHGSETTAPQIESSKSGGDKRAGSAILGASESASRSFLSHWFGEDVRDTDNEPSHVGLPGVESELPASSRVVGVEIKRPLDEQQISMMRKSSLDMPLVEPRDEPLQMQETGLTSSSRGPNPFARQYQYSPTSFTLYDKQGGANHEDLYEPRPYTRHLQPGDDVYGSYRSGLFNMARTGEQPLSMVANKSNDVYFLAMVAAFCAMAMAVVLAAGLFAYRIQQNRKMCSETEYPTYGVVGPNNKCGTAAFVGGYFAGHTPGSNSSGSGKGAKHLPEIYSSDSGITHCSSKSAGRRVLAEQSGSQAGTAARGDFMESNQNAARMYHYQHQKQQMIISDRGSNGRHTSASDLDSEEENDDGSYTVYECPGLASAHEMEIKNPLFNDDRTP